MESSREVFARIKKLVICACGTSFYASLLASKLMRQLHLFDSVHLVDASEFDMDYFPSLNDTALLVVSQSGETADVLRAMKKAQAQNVFVFAVVNVVSSQIATLARCGVYTNSGREFGVASTKSFTGQAVVLALISLWFASHFHREETEPMATEMLESISRIPLCLPTALELREQCREIAHRVYKNNTLFVLGKGLGEAIAKEAALKIKEIAYIHAEGFSSGELKHGPFALIEKGTPVFVILLNDGHQRLIRIACKQVCARGAELFVVTDSVDAAKGVHGTKVMIPSVGSLTALVAIVPFQLIAYEAALRKGLDPDKPRNLAKAVTVD